MGRVCTLNLLRKLKALRVSLVSNLAIEWLSYTKVGYDDVNHLRIKEGGEGKQISGVISGMEICHSSGVEMMRRFGVQGF
jgi:hypothetical protein